MPLPPAEVGFVLARLHQIEQEAEPADVVGLPGGEGEVRAGRVQGRPLRFSRLFAAVLWPPRDYCQHSFVVAATAAGAASQSFRVRS